MDETFLPNVEEAADNKGEIKIDASDLKVLHLPQTECGDEVQSKSNQRDGSTPIRKSSVLDYGNECFLLKNVLSEEECAHFIKEGEDVGFEAIRLAAENYRSNTRISFQSPELGELLWKRISPFLHAINIDGDPLDQHIEGIPSLMQGHWKPKKLNDIFRLCRYFPGGHFAPHYDGFFAESSQERSLQTFMLYLNGDFSGGSTNFIDSSQKLFKGPDGKYCAEEKNILYKVKPEPGMAIVFNHNRLHEGERLGYASVNVLLSESGELAVSDRLDLDINIVKDGKKYILRTDIMFENSNPKSMSKNQEIAIQLLQEADRLESAGRCMESMELYRKAYKLFPDLDSARGVL